MSSAIVINRTGGPEVLEFTEVDPPTPDAGELLVEVAAAGVNFIDIYLRTGAYPTELPSIPGKEGAGTVVAVGADVQGFATGDRVAWAMGTGAYAQFATVDAALAVHVPKGVDDRTAAASLLQGMTAHFLATSIVPLEAGDTVLLHAGAGGVGLLLTQLLARRGVRVITTVSTTAKAELSRAAGAVQVVDYTDDDFVARVRDRTDGRGARAVFDGVGASTFEGSLDATATRGVVVVFGAASGPVPPVDPQTLAAKGSLLLTRPSLTHFIAERSELEWRASEIFTAIEAGHLDVRIGATYDLADAAQAHTDLAARSTTGKLLLIP